MAVPMNPLDVYSAYTYHFELHFARSWEGLQDELQAASDESTIPTEPNGTLLINTRKDAHQTIDNVNFLYISPRVDPTGTTASVLSLSLSVIEPNGTSFIEKLQNAMEDNGISDLMRGGVFLLKIVFVGRHPDNSVDVDELDPVCIPLQIKKITADFTYKGGTYAMEFEASGAGAISNNYVSNNQISGTDGYSHKNVAIKARTVREALVKLETALNENYQEAYKWVEMPGRPIRYEIVLDPRIDGNLDLITKESNAPDELRQMTFQPEIPIIEMIKRIVQSSTEINDMISESADGIRQEFHPNVRYPTYSMRYHLTESEAIITYEVLLYEGDSGTADTFEFDFMFAVPPGKNVDVIRFEMKYNMMIAWLSASFDNSVAWHTNQDNEVAENFPGHYKDAILRPNKRADKFVNQDAGNVSLERLSLDLRENDVKPAPGANVRESSGHVQLTHTGAQAARLAFNTISEINGAANHQLTFDIRGHYLMLFPCIPTPDGRGFAATRLSSGYGFGQQDSVWVKVNVRNQDYQEFFYTGYYELFSVNNIFSNGQFIQQLTVIMKNRVTSSSGLDSRVPESNTSPTQSQGSRGESELNAGDLTGQ